MAKRRRLSPANPAYLDGKPPLTRFSEDVEQPTSPAPKRAPIADVASDASAQSALQELSGVLANARSKGLMIEELPLEAIDKQHLVRDRIEQNEDDMDALVGSLQSRGQQTPIEVVKLNSKTGHRYGLISGWRRMLALQRLNEAEPHKGFDKVLARVIQPETAHDAYVAMVEENEIRVNLSHYERARIAVKAIAEGVYETQKQALNGLFGNVARSKRSKIGSFMRLVEALDNVLYYPASISEKLGLALVRELNQSPDFAEALRNELLLTERPVAEVEIEVLVQAVKVAQGLQDSPVSIPEPGEDGFEDPVNAAPPAPSAKPATASGTKAPAPERFTQKITAGLSLSYTPQKGRIELTGDAVTEDLKAALEAWLKTQTGG